MIEWPCFSSSLAREKTARAPSPFNCETRVAIRRVPMGSSLSFRGGRRRDGKPGAINETWKNFECGGGQKTIDEIRLQKNRAQFGKETVLNGLGAQRQPVCRAEFGSF